MDLLQELINKCKCGVYVYVNNNRDYYQPLNEYIEEQEYVKNEVISEMEKNAILLHGNIVEVRFYPHTPIGFEMIVHYNLETALKEALKWFDN